MTYLWAIEDDYPNKLVGEYDRDLSPSRFLLSNAEPLLGAKMPVINFECKASVLKSRDDLPNDADIPLISPKVIDILGSFGVNMQLIDVKVIAEDEIITDYKLLNVLTAEACLNKEKSDFIYVPGTKDIMMFNHCVYNKMNSTLARDKDYMVHLLVKEELAEVLLNNTKGIELKLMNK